MTISRLHTQHYGEAAVQQRRGTPLELAQQIPHFIETNMPQQHADFYAGLQYMPLATLDEKGRPWASVLVTASPSDQSLGMQITAKKSIALSGESNPYDPFLRALKQTNNLSNGQLPLFAGVGIDFSNRRRNKLAGKISYVDIADSGKVHLELASDEHMGNCPKYITVRSLDYAKREPQLDFDRFDALHDALPHWCSTLINSASTVFLATKHIPVHQSKSDYKDMGLNHRGGAPGFVRVYTEEEKGQVSTFLVLPDYSGNRFYQSLGNIQHDKEVGLVFPDFETGDVLYVTGEAENIYDEEAEALMPRVTLLTRIRLTGAVGVRLGIKLTNVVEEQLSPYNPPVRFLRQEKKMAPITTQGTNLAQLLSVTPLSNQVSTFSFSLAKPITPVLPGGFGVFDFSDVIQLGYRHMDATHPQRVNDDAIRTWTLSSSPTFNADTGQFNALNTLNITVKRKDGGLVSSFLHDVFALSPDRKNDESTVKFKGVGGDFTCFRHDSKSERIDIPNKMLWIAGGVGITPFMAMWDGLVSMANAYQTHQDNMPKADILLLFAGRDDEVVLLRHFLSTLSQLKHKVSLTVQLFQTAGRNKEEAQHVLHYLLNDYPDAAINVLTRRIQQQDVANIEDLSQREAFLCGPDLLMNNAKAHLLQYGGRGMTIHHESYGF